MIIKPVRRGGFTAMGKYILDLGDNDAKAVLGIFNLPLANDVWDAMAQMRLMMGEKLHGPHRVEKYFEHIVFRPAKGENLTRAQYDEMKVAVLKRMGYENCPRVEWEDTLKGEVHQHMCVLRMDMDGNLVHPYRRYEACIEIAREFEKKFGLKSSIKSESKNVYYNAKAEIAALWQKTDGKNGRETREEFEQNGFILARGDRGQYLFISAKTGQPYNPARIPELKKQELNEAGVRQRFTGVPVSSLPTAQEVRSQLKIEPSILRKGKRRSKITRARIYKSGNKHSVYRTRPVGRRAPVIPERSNGGLSIIATATASKPDSSTTSNAATGNKGSSPPSLSLPNTKRGWPEAARIDWELWGHNHPAKFFAKWPELAPPGFTPLTKPCL